MRSFDNLKYKQIKSLLEIVNNAKERNIDTIKKRHDSISMNFSDTLRFLKELKILKENNGKVYISIRFEPTFQSLTSDKLLKAMLLKALLNTKCNFYKDIKDFLDNFKATINSFEYGPNTNSRIKESGVRNFLIELDLIEYVIDSKVYKIKESHFDSFEVYLNRKKISPKEFAIMQKRKVALGKAAELEIFRFEKERLKKFPELLSRIEHTAKINVRAGYDILSWDKEKFNQNFRDVPRYIEVKAISIEGCRFYWTRNEIEKAQELGERYCLYLLPVIGEKQFDVEALKIIPDPISKIFNNSDDWRKQVETYLFYQNSIIS